MISLLDFGLRNGRNCWVRSFCCHLGQNKPHREIDFKYLTPEQDKHLSIHSQSYQHGLLPVLRSISAINLIVIIVFDCFHRIAQSLQHMQITLLSCTSVTFFIILLQCCLLVHILDCLQPLQYPSLPSDPLPPHQLSKLMYSPLLQFVYCHQH